MFKKLLAVLTGVLFSMLTLTAQAKTFKNAYVSFELPEIWDCVLEHTEWVCRSKDEKESKQAIIILTAKEVGPTDSFASYEGHLKDPLVNGNKTAGVPSKVIYPPKQVQINDQTWIDGLHLASEVPNYFTRYLATIKEKIAVLVTFSAHKDHYTRYSNDFFRSVQSLRVIAAKNLLADSGSLRPDAGLLGPNGPNYPGDLQGTDATAPTGEGGGKRMRSILILIAALVAGIALFIVLKMRKK